MPKRVAQMSELVVRNQLRPKTSRAVCELPKPSANAHRLATRRARARNAQSKALAFALVACASPAFPSYTRPPCAEKPD